MPTISWWGARSPTPPLSDAQLAAARLADALQPERRHIIYRAAAISLQAGERVDYINTDGALRPGVIVKATEWGYVIIPDLWSACSDG
jgi:hypothetical protein